MSGFSDLFLGPRERGRRRQCEFHLKVAEPMRAGALRYDEKLWRDYFDELERAVAARPETIEAHWLRAEALQHWFVTFNPPRKEPETREMARTWNNDITFILTNYPDRDLPSVSLNAARAMRREFEVQTRGVKIE